MIINLYTDGACRGNGKENARAAIGIVLKIGIEEAYFYKEVINFEENTNNKAEIYAIIKGLELLSKKHKPNSNFEKDKLIIYSDSNYTIQGITNWINGWRANGWITSSRTPVKNVELWKKLDYELEKINKNYDIEFVKVKGHSDNEWNNKCDQLANEALDMYERGVL